MRRHALQGGRAIVAADSVVMREALRRYLSDCGMNVVDAPLDRLHRLLDAALESGEPFDIAVIDCHVANDSCLSQVVSLVDDPRLARLPVVLVVPKNKTTSGHAALPAVTHKLRKPVHRSDIENLLAKVEVTDRATGLGSPRANDASRSRNARILVVEDNAVNQKIALKMLEKLGYDAELAQHGREALTMLGRARYDLVFMDCQMPELDGFEATAELRNLERVTGRHTIVVAMTANVLEGAREACLHAGMDDYVTKSVKSGDLIEIIRRWVPNEASQSDLPRLRARVDV
jgi:CheY-like chemotaxis protein